jgi:hypothetical protein
MGTAMPDLLVQDIDAELHARLSQWAAEQGRPLSQLARDILAAAERVRENFQPWQNDSTVWIRRCRDGGCGLCDELEPLFAPGDAAAREARGHNQ